ncbi:MAG: CAP domain-containing protein [Ilumatobacteraceae bacterium]
MHLDVPYISARRVRHNLGAFGMTAALGLFSVGGLATRCAPQPPPIEQVADVQQPVVDSANQYRAQSGLGAVSIDQRLTNAAQSHANDMAARSVMTHTGASGSTAGQRINVAGYGWTTWAENVAAGQTTPGEVMNAWMNSPGHAANVRNRNMINIGVAAAVGANGVTYWAMVLAA